MILWCLRRGSFFDAYLSDAGIIGFAVRIVHFDEKRRIHKQAALPITEWFDVGCRPAWGGWPWAGRAGAWASSDSHARLCSGESAICGMPRVKVDAMRGNTSASAPITTTLSFGRTPT